MTVQLDYLNLAIELSGMVLCLLGVLLVRIGTMADKPTEKYFLLSYLALLLFAGANLAGQLMRGHPGAGYRAALYVSNFIEFFCLKSARTSYTKGISYYNEEKTQRKDK